MQKKWRFYIQKKKIDDEEETNKKVLTRWERDLNLGKYHSLKKLLMNVELSKIKGLKHQFLPISVVNYTLRTRLFHLKHPF